MCRETIELIAKAARLWEETLDPDERTADELACENPNIPVLTFEEVPQLQGKPPELLHSILDFKLVFKGADSRLEATEPTEEKPEC